MFSTDRESEPEDGEVLESSERGSTEVSVEAPVAEDCADCDDCSSQEEVDFLSLTVKRPLREVLVTDVSDEPPVIGTANTAPTDHSTEDLPEFIALESDASEKYSDKSKTKKPKRRSRFSLSFISQFDSHQNNGHISKKRKLTEAPPTQRPIERSLCNPWLGRVSSSVSRNTSTDTSKLSEDGIQSAIASVSSAKSSAIDAETDCSSLEMAAESERLNQVLKQKMKKLLAETALANAKRKQRELEEGKGVVVGIGSVDVDEGEEDLYGKEEEDVDIDAIVGKRWPVPVAEAVAVVEDASVTHSSTTAYRALHDLKDGNNHHFEPEEEEDFYSLEMGTSTMPVAMNLDAGFEYDKDAAVVGGVEYGHGNNDNDVVGVGHGYGHGVWHGTGHGLVGDSSAAAIGTGMMRGYASVYNGYEYYGGSTLLSPTMVDSQVRYNGAIAPWLQRDYSHLAFSDRLHEELVDFALYHSPTEEEHSARKLLIEEVRRVVATVWPTASVQVFGSFKTRLYLPHSDLDCVVFTDESHGVSDEAMAHGLLRKEVCIAKLEQLKDVFIEEGLVSYAEVIGARVPIIKMTDAQFDIDIDITLNRRSGLHSADAISYIVDKHPAARPLALFLKYFLWYRNLHEVYRGGMGSYMLYMLLCTLFDTFPMPKQRIVGSSLKGSKPHSASASPVSPQYTEDGSSEQRTDGMSLGSWLLAFFEMYGRTFNYSALGIEPYPKAGFFDKSTFVSPFAASRSHLLMTRKADYQLCLRCPFEEGQDTGKNSYQIMKIKCAFEYARNRLITSAQRLATVKFLAAASGSVVGQSTESLLDCIVAVRSTLLVRRARRRRVQLVRDVATNNVTEYFLASDFQKRMLFSKLNATTAEKAGASISGSKAVEREESEDSAMDEDFTAVFMQCKAKAASLNEDGSGDASQTRLFRAESSSSSGRSAVASEMSEGTRHFVSTTAKKKTTMAVAMSSSVEADSSECEFESGSSMDISAARSVSRSLSSSPSSSMQTSDGSSSLAASVSESVSASAAASLPLASASNSKEEKDTAKRKTGMLVHSVSASGFGSEAYGFASGWDRRLSSRSMPLACGKSESAVPALRRALSTTASAVPTPGSSNSMTPCWFYFSDGGCRHGAHCYYSHDLALAQKSRPLCSNWSAYGSCQFGQRCRFSHDNVKAKSKHKSRHKGKQEKDDKKLHKLH